MATTDKRHRTEGDSAPKAVRTNIVLDDALVQEARKYSTAKTKRGLVEEALRLLIQIGRQGSVRRLRGRIEWEGDLDELRRGRFVDR